MICGKQHIQTGWDRLSLLDCFFITLFNFIGGARGTGS
ncbi:hypothetical protein RD1_3389 [Roseobacter denitrificans OCh 114]|uniref:Uncharacterized protein n=1 Tax=Roseobacter denitrificans (strain ATCC 33942 / OCh 114) TaxID=375451 RepID=Q163G2_ROSDO|nr:hypothetical protein RD1_3389 [Roseobacter denitrificans OCh 114]